MLNNDGLVGRVLRVTRTTATVLLIVDTDSVVGGRVGESMEVGFLHGRGVLGERRPPRPRARRRVRRCPAKDDTVVTWGSEGGAPYVAGVPVGRVTSVYSSLRETSQRAVIDPYVDFGALDLVGVVVPSGTASDRAVIEADGSLQMSRARAACVAVAAPSRSAAGPPGRRSSRTSPGRASCPNLCLLVVVGAALTRGPQFAAVLGFVAGVALDLAPPADHVAGRWALALVVVGLRRRPGAPGRPADRARPWSPPSPRRRSSAPRSSRSAGCVLRDPALGVPDLLQVILVAVRLGRAAHAVRAAAGDGACSAGSSRPGRA